MLEAGTPRVAEHTFQDTDDFGADVGLAAGVAELKGVEGDGVGGVGRVEIDDILNTAFRHEAEVVDGEIAVRVDDTITLIIKDVAEGKKLQHTGFAGAGLADNVDVAGAVATIHAELVIDAAEISQAEGGNVLVVGGVASDEGELGGRLGGLGRSPDDVGGLDGSVGEVVDGS